MISLQEGTLRLVLHEPEDGFYLGTRFDRSGVFDSIVFRGTEMAGRWFERYDPHLHDTVCGPAEEFSAIGFEEASPGGTFLKVGVGLLTRPDALPYDRFRLYAVADPGEWTVSSDGGAAVFRHLLEGWYEYEKRVLVTSEDRFSILHRLHAFRPLKGDMYNHHFFTLGKMETGPGRTVEMPFCPDGTWRAEYDKVSLTGQGIRFGALLEKGESVYMGNLHARGGGPTPYSFEISEGSRRVSVRGDAPVDHAVFWANHRIACIEPYVLFDLGPEEEFTLRLDYGFL